MADEEMENADTSWQLRTELYGHEEDVRPNFHLAARSAAWKGMRVSTSYLNLLSNAYALLSIC